MCWLGRCGIQDRHDRTPGWGDLPALLGPAEREYVARLLKLGNTMATRRFRLSSVALVVAGFALAVPLAGLAATAAQSNFNGDLQWRLIGPFRGGWGTMAQGIPDRPDTYYFIAAGGGVWRTVDAGRTWQSLGNDLPASAMGALAIAPSKPDVIYLGS